MSKKEFKFKRKWLGVFVGKKIGKCMHCEDYVYDNQLYIESNESLSHYSCHNYSKVEENDE